MRSRDLVEAIHGAFPADRAVEQIEDLMALDRFQASAGIETAADRVAAAAEEAGLTVAIHRFPADGGRHWWTFRSPRSWTPRSASLSIVDEEGHAIPLASYPEDPLSLATYSASTPEPGVVAPLVEFSPSLPDAELAGRLLVVPPGVSLAAAIARATAGGALGVAANVVPSQFPERVGRIELGAFSPLFAWSLSFLHLGELLAAARAGRQAQVRIEVDRKAAMPVVEAVLPGEGAGEVLLVSHLCHPRPGANDNLSGVAALLGVAEALQKLGREGRLPAGRPGLRFLWGPEFTGTAAYLHELAGTDGRLKPDLALNLDMVGEYPHLSGGPLIVERSPDYLPTVAAALAEHCLELVPVASRSYSGAVAARPWAFAGAPFVGASDHGLLADRAIGCPAIQLGHWPDVFNHTSDDTLDKVDPEALRRTAAAAAATALLALPADRGAQASLRAIVARHAARRLLDLARAGAEERPADPEVVDPFAPEAIGGLLAHTAEVAVRSLPGDEGDEGRAATARFLREQADLAARLLPTPPAAPAGDPAGPPLERTWDGPWNLFGLLEDANAADALWIRETLGRQKGAYGLFTGLTGAIDGRRDRAEVLRQAAYSTELAIRRDTAQGFFDVLRRAGWIAER